MRKDSSKMKMQVIPKCDFNYFIWYKAFFGQATAEGAFKNLKNPYHLAATPGFHWTDQKIKIHYMICVMGYLLSSLLGYEAKKAGINTTLDNLMDSLNGIHLGRFVEASGKPGRPKITHRLEDLSEDQKLYQMK